MKVVIPAKSNSERVHNKNFCEFEDCLKTWSEARAEHDSLVVVKPLTEFILDANGRPVNYQFGPWHLASQFLPKWFSVPHALHIVKCDTVRRCNYLIGTVPNSTSARRAASPSTTSSISKSPRRFTSS